MHPSTTAGGGAPRIAQHNAVIKSEARRPPTPAATASNRGQAELIPPRRSCRNSAPPPHCGIAGTSATTQPPANVPKPAALGAGGTRVHSPHRLSRVLGHHHGGEASEGSETEHDVGLVCLSLVELGFCRCKFKLTNLSQPTPPSHSSSPPPPNHAQCGFGLALTFTTAW